MDNDTQLYMGFLKRLEDKFESFEKALMEVVHAHDSRITKLERWLWIVPTSLSAAILILAIDMFMSK